MKEQELAKAVTDFLAHPLNDIFKEVPCYGYITDIVIKRGDDLIAIETKTSFGLAVIEQAHRNKRYYNYSYVAVPLTKVTFALQICKDYGIGVIIVDTKRGNRVYEEVKPKYTENVKRPKLREWMKRNNAGVQSDRLTSFKVFIESVEEQLINGPMNHKDLFKTCYKHYSNPLYLKNNLIQHIKTGLIKNFHYGGGKFLLKEK